MKAGFIGLGVQGKHLAINQARAGHELTVYDVREEPLKELADVGARVAGSCREVAQRSDIVQICVLDDAQLEAVALGADGVLGGCAPGRIAVIHSTGRPATVAKISAAAVTQGVRVLERPGERTENGREQQTRAHTAA